MTPGVVQGYTRANTDWLAACRYGIGVHWTARTVPRQGRAVTFPKAVAQFRLEAFLDAVEESGADYVIFTATHAVQMLPGPHPVVDSLLSGRTAERDLIGELARGLRARAKHLIVYYNHSCNQGDDPAWEQAVGYHDGTPDRFVANLLNIVQWMGQRYGDQIEAWWFDSSYSLDPTGPTNTVTTKMEKFRFPWEQLTQAAKDGHANRLVTYNAGTAATCLYTPHQDYWAGELTDLHTPPTSRYLPNGLQWHGWTCLDHRDWVYTNNETPPPQPLYSVAELVAFLSLCRSHQAPMCFNVIIWQDGTISPQAVDYLRRTGEILGKT